MKRIICIFFIAIPNICVSQSKEMMEAISKRKPDEAIAIGKTLLENQPNSFETNFLFAKAYNLMNDYNNALSYAEKAKRLTKEDWQKAWLHVETIQTYFGLGQINKAKLSYEEAKQLKGTKNSENELKYWEYYLVLMIFIKNGKTIESENLVFHFQSSISEDRIKFIVSSRQKAFEKINLYFNSNLPKKIDFFVWDLATNFNPYLKSSLGFTRPEFCLSHNRLNQSPGHEIAHSISHWRNPNAIKTRFINEGIGVNFDQNETDKLKSAQEANKMNSIPIKNIWEFGHKVDAKALYPISGAFVEFLIKYDKEKFLILSENQTYENAKLIYGEKIDELIKEFSDKLDINSR